MDERKNCKNCRNQICLKTGKPCREIDELASKDWGHIQELNIGQPEFYKGQVAEFFQDEPFGEAVFEEGDPSGYPHLELYEIATLALDKNHFTATQIAKVLHLTPQGVYKILRRVSKKESIKS